MVEGQERQPAGARDRWLAARQGPTQRGDRGTAPGLLRGRGGGKGASIRRPCRHRLLRGGASTPPRRARSALAPPEPVQQTRGPAAKGRPLRRARAGGGDRVLPLDEGWDSPSSLLQGTALGQAGRGGGEGGSCH